MQKTPLYKRCLPALALILALMLPLVSLAEVSKVVKGRRAEHACGALPVGAGAQAVSHRHVDDGS